ncbi:C-X-C chemokine receptor type 3-like isoform X2 [Stegastes partitus]|nr:PREDICTED: C-X-C chemokine receptor type 3-like isoform X2 [Stegastes partitus]
MDVDLDGLFRQNTSYDYDMDYEYKDEFDSSNKAVWMPVLYTLVLIVGLLGNVLLLIIVAQRRLPSWSVSDFFVVHLSAADILLLVTLPFWSAQAAQNWEWCFGIFCKICGAVFNINFYCGIFLLVCITLDRYLSTIHAINLYSHKKPWLVHISCLLVWLVSLLLTIPDWIFLVTERDLATGRKWCAYRYSESVTDWKLLSRLLHHMVGFGLPAGALIFCWSCILLQRSSKGQTQRSIMVILPLMLVFFLCWMPYNITLIVDTSRRRSKESHNVLSGNPEGSLKTALAATSALGCIHACLRPLLYLGLCSNFRKRLLAMLTFAQVESSNSLWELNVGEEALPDQSHEGEELKQMTSEEHQVQTVQCR